MLKNTLAFCKYFALIGFLLIGALGIYGVINTNELWIWQGYLNDKLRFGQLYIDILVLFCGLFAISFIPKNAPRLGASALFFLIFYLSHQARALGDHDYWYSISGELDDALLSEFLGTMLYHIIAYIHKPFLFYVAPFLGCLTALSFLYYTNRLLNESNDRKIFLIISLYYAASPIQLIFFTNFIEYTCTSIMFLPAYIYFCAMYMKATDSKTAWIYLGKAALAISLASLFHGMNVFVWPVLLFCAILKNDTIKNKLLHIISYIISTTAFCLLVILVVKLCGYAIVDGHLSGGGDWHAIKTLHASDSIYQSFDMYSKGFFMELANIILLSNISAPFFVFSLLWIRKKNNQLQSNEIITETVLMITGFAFISFIFLWNFDLGFPTDFDLMLSMGIVFTMLTTHYFLKTCKTLGISKYILLQPVAANMLYAWIYITYLS